MQELSSQEAVGPDTARTLPVTPRTVESLIRLAKAHAKARFSKIVEAQDVKTAVDL